MLFYLWFEESGKLPGIFREFDSLSAAEQVCSYCNASLYAEVKSLALFYVTSAAGEVLA
jgi:hypothetical protein